MKSVRLYLKNTQLILAKNRPLSVKERRFLSNRHRKDRYTVLQNASKSIYNAFYSMPYCEPFTRQESLFKKDFVFGRKFKTHLDFVWRC